MSLEPRRSGRSPKHPCIACGKGVGRAHRCRRCGAAQRVRELQVESVLATGPRGRVYRARDARGEAVVLKELAFATVPDILTLELFSRECDALRRLSHPRIPRFIDGFRDGEGAQLRFYLAQTYLPGENLEDRLGQHSFDEADAKAIAREVLEVLAYLHTRSPIVVHRDVKPANVLALEGGRYGLVDFGVVRSGAGEGGASSVVGTFGYMPPEQLFREADARSDLYALGMTLCRLLTRKRPEELLTPGLEVHFRPHANVSPGFAGFLDRLVARDPARRFESAAQAIDALHQTNAPAPKPTLESPLSGLIPRSAMPRREPKVIVSPELLRRAPSRASDASNNDDDDELPPSRGIRWRLRFGKQSFLLEPGGTYVAGRDDDCDLRLDDDLEGWGTVSRHHLRLSVTRSGLLVEELGSRNGTWVGREYIRPAGEKVLVREGVELQLGDVLGEVAPAYRMLDASPIDRPLTEARRRAKALRTELPRRLGYLGGDPEGVRILRRWSSADGLVHGR